MKDSSSAGPQTGASSDLDPEPGDGREEPREMDRRMEDREMDKRMEDRESSRMSSNLPTPPPPPLQEHISCL